MSILVVGSDTPTGKLFKSLLAAHGHRVLAWSTADGVNLLHGYLIASAARQLYTARQQLDVVIYTQTRPYDDPFYRPEGEDIGVAIRNDVTSAAMVQWNLHEAKVLREGTLIVSAISNIVYHNPPLPGRLVYEATQAAWQRVTEVWEARYPQYKHQHLLLNLENPVEEGVDEFIRRSIHNDAELDSHEITV